MIENSNIQNFIFLSLQLDRHIITEFDKMKIDIHAIRLYTFIRLPILFQFKVLISNDFKNNLDLSLEHSEDST